MNEPFTYTDRDGDELKISRSDAWPDQIFIRPASDGAYVAAADLPKIVAEMYKAAGVPAPVVHEHVDDEGQGLSIVSSEYRPNIAFVEGCNGAYVTPEDLPGLVRKLYEAAGQEPPIILPRYKPDALMTRGGKVRPMLTPTGDDMDVTEARDLASWYATAADLADAEPDPEQVKQLAYVIGGMYVRSPEAIARAVLAAGYSRSES